MIFSFTYINTYFEQTIAEKTFIQGNSSIHEIRLGKFNVSKTIQESISDINWHEIDDLPFRMTSELVT